VLNSGILLWKVVKLRYLTYALCAFFVISVLGAPSCSGKITPEGQSAAESEVTVPGLAESLEVKDRTIKVAVLAAIKSDVELLQNNIEVEVTNGLVTLTGVVPTEEMKKRAEKYARETEAVKDVLNKIEVDESLKDKRFSIDDA